MSFTDKLKSDKKSARNKAFEAAMLHTEEEIALLKKKAEGIIAAVRGVCKREAPSRKDDK